MDIQGGSLSGAGSVSSALRNAASVKPGLSPGVLSVNGSCTQTSAGHLEIEVYGTNLASFDRLVVSGAATLDGTLDVHSGSFTPTASDSFAFLSGSSRTGMFSTVTGASLGTGSFGVDYGASSAALVFHAAKASQTITFATIPAKTLAQSPVTVSASVSSGLAVTLASTTPAVCTVSGSSVPW